MQDFVCGMKLLSETSMQESWTFNVFQEVYLHARMQDASFPARSTWVITLEKYIPNDTFISWLSVNITVSATKFPHSALRLNSFQMNRSL